MTDLRTNQYGFSWGGAIVQRVTSYPPGPKGHKIISVEGKRGRAEIRVTPAGYVRVRLFKRRGGAWEEKP